MPREVYTACRHCGKPLVREFVDLGTSPLANSYLKPEQLHQMEPCYPLRVFVCDGCFLVQLPEVQSPHEIFSEYAYFSSYSDSWLEHAREYTRAMVDRFEFGSSHRVIEVASNDGYLLRHFKDRGIPVMGVEPAKNVATAAESVGIPTLTKFFGRQTALEMVQAGHRADLLIGNNVLAHVPDINDFVEGLRIALNPGGLITMEFPHLLTLIEENQFDTIYHEHFSYLSFMTVCTILASRGLLVFDVEELPTHGGSLRVYACHSEDASRSISPRVSNLLDKEKVAGLADIHHYTTFGESVKRIKLSILEFMIRAKREGKNIIGYGAPAKGNTLLNYCGIRTDFIDYTVDKNPHKQGHYLPGTHIPIYAPEKIRETRPDILIVLPWNLKDEIVDQMSYVRDWDGRFVVLIPHVEVIS